ncbi:hypothetical protein MKX03_003946 [Papaver bracteatum]|nr:hypothetical protein MKX03_003946 [Papaver bracteatum]
MAMKNTLILCFFLVLSIFFAGGKAIPNRDEPCTMTWVSACTNDNFKECKDRCNNDYGSQAIASCVGRSKQERKNLCKCKFC